MNKLELRKSERDEELMEISDMAEEIWHEHFTDIIGEDQVNYMVEKFQSFPALQDQIRHGYEYYRLYLGEKMAGYMGIHEAEGKLFLSKLYLHKDFRGRHLSTQAFSFLKQICRERGLRLIWLTCNRHNSHTLKVYEHLGFRTVRMEKNDIGNGFFMDDHIMEYELA